MTNDGGTPMIICVGENINVMTKPIGAAFKQRNAQIIQDMAKAEAEHGADYLDLNIGPARKGGDELMSWLVQTVQDVVHLPMSLDTTNPIAMEAGLKVHRGRNVNNRRVEISRSLLGKNAVDMLFQVHEDSIWILENLGVECKQPNIQESFQRFETTGEAIVYEDRIYVTKGLIERCLETVPGMEDFFVPLNTRCSIK